MSTLPSKVAVIDIGSNSSKVLIAAVNENGFVEKLFEESHSCRLFDSRNLEIKSISLSAIQKLETALEKLFSICSREKVDGTAVVATEAIRRASNAHEVKEAIEQNFSCQLRVLSGEEEASFIAKGVILDPVVSDIQNFHAFDLGGGSLELIESFNNSYLIAKSLPLGVLSLIAEFHPKKEKVLTSDAEKKIRERLGKSFKESGLVLDSSIPIVGLGGVVVFLRMILSRKKNISFENLSQFSLTDIAELTQEISRMNLGQRIASFPELPSDRADVFPVACVIVEEILINLSKTTLFHSFSNLRYGIASSWGTDSDLFNLP